MNEQNTTLLPRRTFIAGAATMGVLALASPTRAFADEISDKQAEADAAYASLSVMQHSLDEASDTYTEALNEQAEAQQKQEDAQEQIDEKNASISENQDKLAATVKQTYKTGPGQFLDLLLGATSFEEFATGLDFINDISSDTAQLEAALKSDRAQLEEAKAEYAAQEQIAAEKAETARKTQESAQATVNQYQATYNSLSSEVQALVAQQQAAEEAAHAANAAQTMELAVQQGQADEEQIAQQSTSDSGNASSDDNGSSNRNGGRSSNAKSNSNSNTASNTTNSSGSTTNSSSSTKKASRTYDGGSDAVSRAYACIGAPYVWAAVGPEAYDCSGLVSYCLTGRHARVYTSSSLMGYSAVSDPQPGDVAVKSGHCGIYIGGSQMIHAPTEGQTVCVTSVQSGMKFVRP